jgi:hypothetical protein
MRTAALEPGLGGQQPDPESEAGVALGDREAHCIAMFDAALGALELRGAPTAAEVRRLCEGAGETPRGLAAFRTAMEGLKALADHWKIG